MSTEVSPQILELPLRDDFVAGIDVGGTKVHIADSLSTTVHRFNTPEFESMDEVLDTYFIKMGARPVRACIGMAGPRDDETGSVQLTNVKWPLFEPAVASKTYTTDMFTANDMPVAMAGVLQETGVDLTQLKAGSPPVRTGAKVIVSISTGMGVGAAIWDERSQRYVLAASEGGHIGWQPKNEYEQDYLKYLNAKYPHASAEFALAGKYGIDNLVNHSLKELEAPGLVESIVHAREHEQPVGAVLLAYATEAKGPDQQVAKIILQRMGAMVGSFMRDIAVAYKSTGGVYLTGSVALGLSEYFAEHTEMNKRFVRQGATHDTWLEKMPISLVTDPHIAVVGAMALAKAA